MPIIKAHNNFIYFSHIPKCAGTSIEKYLIDLPKCDLLFVDKNFTSKSPLKKWASSSPQHLPGNLIKILFGENFFDEYFAVLRDPIERFKSAFIFHISQKTIKADIDANLFIKKILLKNYKNLSWYDNHFLPQIKFLVPGANYKLFYMNKNGLSNLKRYLDILILNKETDNEILKLNYLSRNFANKKENLTLDEESINILKNIYKDDFYLTEILKKDCSIADDQFFFLDENDKNYIKNIKHIYKKKGLANYIEKYQNDITKLNKRNISDKSSEIEILRQKNLLKDDYIKDLLIINKKFNLENIKIKKEIDKITNSLIYRLIIFLIKVIKKIKFIILNKFCR